MRYHVGSNMPGYLPESDVWCVDNINEAISLLRHDARDASEMHYGSHHEECVKSEEDSDCDCPCEHHGAYTSALALLSHIADGDTAWHVENRGGISWQIGRLMYWIKRDVGCEGCEDEAA